MIVENVIVDVVIPVFNEEKSIAKVIQEIPKEIVRNIVVGNNNSTDNSKQVAENAGAIVIDEPKKGYGNACLAALNLIHSQEIKPDIIVFIDGDYSDYPEEMPKLIAPILNENYDLVLGSRALGKKQKGSMTFPQIFGNWLAVSLIKLFYKQKFTDLGPFRTISYEKYLQLGMKDKNFGWTVEMQIKAAKQKLKCTEIPVRYRKRIGKSKVSGTVTGTISAGYKILFTIFKYL